MAKKSRLFELRREDNGYSLTLNPFSPREPLFRGRTGRQQNSLRLFCFLPVNLVFIVAALLSRCRCGGACPPTRREILS